MKRRTRHHGFSLVELLIAVAILAALLTAVAAAMQASLQSYSENEEIAEATQLARGILDRMSRELRTADQVQWDGTSLIIVPPANDDNIEQIWYSAGDGGLYYTVFVNGNGTTHTLVGPDDEAVVTAFSVMRETGVDWQGETCTRSVTARLGLAVDGQTFAVTTTTAPRRNLIW
jgi:prepilin-type N-terminal cleavage/methylation domain-containing protein